MDTFDCRALKNTAQNLLRGGAGKSIAWLYAGIVAGTSAAVSVLTFLLSRQIAGTGGLSGLPARTALATAASVLEMGVQLALPFLAMGYLAAVLRLSRQEPADRQLLLEGFRNFGPVLRLLLLKGLVYLLVGFACTYPAMMLVAISPWGTPVLESILLGTQSPEAMVPMVVVFLILYLCVCAPIYYRLRLADFALMDNPTAGALAAMRTSLILTRHRSGLLFRLDVSYWWYYLARVGVLAVAYGDQLLQLGGVNAGLSPDVLFFLTCAVSLALDALLTGLKQNEVETAHALCYGAFSQTPNA